MSDVVSLEVVDNIAIVTVDRPPVNAINRDIRAGMLAAFQHADGDDSAHAIVLICAGKTFMAGADMKEFDAPIEDPGYHETYNRIESCGKPVIAALHGTALGGGLEAALACHYRLASSAARMGLPELSLGIIPGAGGTQRLPRLIGAKAALEFIIGISPVSAEKALEMGMIDQVIDGDLKAGGLDYAKSLVASGSGPRPTRDMEVDSTGYTDEFLADIRVMAAKRLRGQKSPEWLIGSISNSMAHLFDAGLDREKIIGEAALQTDEAKALRHLFFAEREVARIPGIGGDTERLPVENIAILGSGTMGGGIAMVFANAGIPVTLIDISDEALARGLATVRKNYENTVKRGRLGESEMEERLGLITGSTDYADMGDKDLVLEAVFEDIDLKKKIFAEIDKFAKPGAILATNTSTLNIDDIASVTSRPQSIIGLHFFSPANVMKLLEIVRTKDTSPEVLITCVELAKRIGKVGVVVGVCFGFVANRMMIEGYIREADQMLLEGATVEQIDKAIYEFGLPMGPWAMSDMAGVDIMYSVLKTTGAMDKKPPPYFNVLYAIADMGRHGQKTGAGFYRYEPGDRTPLHDPITDEVIEKEALRLGIERGDVNDEEIEQRCIFGLINEGAKILEEGIAYRPGDIDVIWTFGYGFPRYRGGPMHYADQLGLDVVYQAVCGYRERFGDYWTPAPLLERLAKEGKTFADWKIEQ